MVGWVRVAWICNEVDREECADETPWALREQPSHLTRCDSTLAMDCTCVHACVTFGPQRLDRLWNTGDKKKGQITDKNPGQKM